MAEADADAGAEAVRKAEIDEHATLPPRAATDLDHACEDVTKAADEWMKKRLEADAEMLARWNETKAEELKKLDGECRDVGSIDVASCQAHALRSAPVTFTHDESTLFLQRCKEKYAG